SLRRCDSKQLNQPRSDAKGQSPRKRLARMLERATSLVFHPAHAISPFPRFCSVYRRRNLDKGKTVQYGGYVGGSTYKTWRFGMADQDPERRVQVSVHLEEALREQLEAAARRSVRSLSGEITFRLKRSLECDSQIDSDAA